MHQLHSAPNSTMGKSKELRIVLKGPLIDLNGKESHLEPFQSSYRSLRSTVQTTVCKYKGHALTGHNDEQYAGIERERPLDRITLLSFA